MSRIKRVRPSTEEDRKLASELRTIIASSRSSKVDKAAAELELDTVAPRLTKRAVKEPSRFGSPNEIRVSKPGTKDLLNLCGRVEARRAGPFSEESMLASLAVIAAEDRVKALRKAENATPLEKAQALISEMPDHPLQKLARESAHYVWEADLSRPKPDLEQMIRWRVLHWLSDAPYNRVDVHSSRETVDTAVADVYGLVAERDATDPGWFVLLVEKRWDAAALPRVKQSEPASEPEQTFSASQQKEAEPEPGPIAKADGRAQLVEMILKTDSFLRSLSAVNFELNEKIRSALTAELGRVGHIASPFAAALYNSLRREYKLFSLPERRF